MGESPKPTRSILMKSKSFRFRVLPAIVAAILPVVLISASSHQSTVNILVQRHGWIRIGLQRGAQSLRVSVSGPFIISTATGQVQRLPSAAALDVRGGPSGVQVNSAGSMIAMAATVSIQPEASASGSFFETPSGRYRGNLDLVGHGGNFDVIEQVQIDDWLKGVLPAEIGNAPPEALKAQAVAARSEAVHKLASPPHAADGFDFCTGEHCQAYKGMAPETPEANAACDVTLGIVLTIGGEVIDAVYHDCCGGMTAGAEDVWDSPPQHGIRAIYDVPGNPTMIDLSAETNARKFLESAQTHIYCNPETHAFPNYVRKYYRWQKTMTAQELRRACGVGRVSDIQVIERRPSGRVRKLQITGDSGSRVVEKELPIRNMLNLWSGFFVIDATKSGDYVDSITITGAGHGHGAGLCQMGARSMAEAGLTYDKILTHYYYGAQVQAVYRR